MTVNYSFLRPLKAVDLKKWYSIPFEKKNELKVETYKNATILPLKRFDGDDLLFGRGGVISETNEYVHLSAINGRIQHSYKYSTSSFINEKVVYCGYLVNQWGHFLIEAVARLWYFLKEDNATIDHYVFFLQSNEKRVISGNYREFFELLGIWNKISIINQPTQYREVIVPELGYNRTVNYTEQYKSIFSKIADNVLSQKTLAKGPTNCSKIFFSRSQMKNINKREFGLEIIDNYFTKNGYKVLYPEKMSLAELIRYIKEAEEIAMYSGSVHIGAGPFIMAYNKYLEHYATDRKMTPPDSKYRSNKYLKKMFKCYMHRYYQNYGFQWFMEDWCVQHTDILREGYKDGFQYFGDFLTGYKPFRLKHYFSTHLWKLRLQKIAQNLYFKYHK